MSIVMTQDIPGTTREMVEAVTKELHLEEGMPHGLIVHTATEVPDGVRIVDVWESEEDFNAFEEERLRPAFARAAEKLGVDPMAGPQPISKIEKAFDIVLP